MKAMVSIQIVHHATMSTQFSQDHKPRQGHSHRRSSTIIIRGFQLWKPIGDSAVYRRTMIVTAVRCMSSLTSVQVSLSGQALTASHVLGWTVRALLFLSGGL